MSPELAACNRLTKDGASSNATIRRRITLIAAERNLAPSATNALMKGRRISLFHLGQFAENHHVSADWLIAGNLKGLLETARGCPSRPRQPTPDEQRSELIELAKSLRDDQRESFLKYLRLVAAEAKLTS